MMISKEQLPLRKLVLCERFGLHVTNENLIDSELTLKYDNDQKKL